MTKILRLLLCVLPSAAWSDFVHVLHCQLMPDQRVFLRGDWTLEDRHLFSGALRQSVVNRRVVVENEREARLIHEIAFMWADEFKVEDLSVIRADYYASYKKLRISLKRGASVAEITKYLNTTLPPRRELAPVDPPDHNLWTTFKHCAEALKI